MTIAEILTSVETSIKNPEERAYFLIHESRYKTILEEIERIARSFGNLRMTVLDVGCFPYHMGAALEKLGYRVQGIASEHEPIANKKVSIINIETDRFPYKSNTFDLVLCSEVLEHLPHSPMPALKEMFRVAKPGGRVLITTPNITRSINLGKMLLGKSPIPPATEREKIYHRHNLRTASAGRVQRPHGSAGGSAHPGLGLGASWRVRHGRISRPEPDGDGQQGRQVARLA